MDEWDDYDGSKIRVTEERSAHIRLHPELAERVELVRQALKAPDFVIVSRRDAAVRLYHKLLDDPLVGRKYLCATVKWTEQDKFLVTAFFTERRKPGDVLWQAQ